jgi:aminoglycoside/choline kinase family phosphotransferase
MQSFIEEQLGKENIQSVTPIAKAGSDRQYVRVVTHDNSYIFCESQNTHENKTFISFAHFFTAKGITVPKILAVNKQNTQYMQSDAGSISLLDALQAKGFTNEVKSYYQKALSALALMQIKASEDFDYKTCFASAQFDANMVLADLNYFKYYFLDLQGIIYDKIALQQAFETLSKSIGSINPQHFMYRDFQGRNIMIQHEAPVFIDFQGGMKGPLQYDVASLLWQAKANLSSEWKHDLYQFYKQEVHSLTHIDEKQFDKDYAQLLLVRLLQVLGAYGLRGIIERRTHFLGSIPQALQNLVQWLSMFALDAYPTLHQLLKIIVSDEIIQKYNFPKANKDTKLKVIVQSFSYKIGGIPKDESGNGGGFVFDCRGVLNPGRFDEYKKFTGRDKPVIEFLESKTNIHTFLNGAKQAVDICIEDYLHRGFENLMISFGCTGGQHRSVYSADAMVKHLQEKYNLNVEAYHIRQEEKCWIN